MLYIEWNWTNYCKLSRNFAGAIRTTTTNCRVGFIDLYLVFPRKCRKVYKHCNFTGTVLLYYHRAWVICGIIRISARRLKWQKRKKTLPNLQYSLTLLLVYRFNTSILMEEALSLDALTTRRNGLIFCWRSSIKLIVRSRQT